MASQKFSKLELHYFFSDDSHVMDAVVRNEAERELLALFKECLGLLGIPYSIEAEAFAEGGLRNVWRIAGSPQAALAVAILALVLSRFPPTDSERQKLENELLELQAEESRLNIEKLRRELGKDAADDDDERNADEKAADELIKSSKVLVRRSNFYSKLGAYHKVRSVSFTPLDEFGEPVGEEREVARKSFPLFVVNAKQLKPISVDGAVIEIVAPVLRDGNYKWKGIYEGEPISFTMSDYNFRGQVRNRQVSFRSGSTITGVLEIQRELDEAGAIKVTGYAVVTVISKNDTEQSFETPQGRTYLQAKKFRESQRGIFDEPET